MGGRGRDVWDDEPATPKQLAFLARLGIAHPPDISLGDASDLITKCLMRRERRSKCVLVIGLLFAIGAIIVFFVLWQAP